MTKTSLRRVAALLIAIAAVSLLIAAAPPEDPWVKKARVESGRKMSELSQEPNNVPDWPPAPGKPFPEITLHDHEGKIFEVKSWKGKPTLIEIVAMTCAGCQAFSGGNKHGGYDGFAVQGGLDSIEKYFKDYTGIDLYSGAVNFAQIIIYNVALNPARPEDLVGWRNHFKFDRHPEVKILTGGKALSNKASFQMIPGFLLLDRDLTVLYDATGHTPRHGLYQDLLPAVRAALHSASSPP